MNIIEKIKLKEQAFSVKEKQFIDFLKENDVYKQSFRFLFVYTKTNKDLLYSMFEGLLKDILIIEFETFIMVIYHNKERIKLNNYLDTLCEDFGVKMRIFEGFLVNKENNNLFRNFIDIYYRCNFNNVNYSSINNLVLEGIFSKEEKKILKDLILLKYINDTQFMKFIYSLFENNLNVSKTAKAIFMHRNTVNNKLSSFENDTTLTLQSFKDAIVVYELLK